MVGRHRSCLKDKEYGPVRGKVSHRLSVLMALSALCVAFLTGCQLTQSAFARAASNAGAGFAAAAQTLRDVHTGRLTTAYARSSFVNFRAELEGIDTHLSSLQGAPDHARIKRLLALYIPAIASIDHPCLAGACDWKRQINALEAASRAFLSASDA